MKIATLNTWKNDGCYFKRVDIIQQQTSLLSPDILCLQEDFCTIDESIHTAKNIAASLGYDWAFCPARLKQRTLEDSSYESYSGLSILYRNSVLEEVLNEALPSNKEDGGRSAQFCKFSKQGYVFTIVNIHLTHTKNQALKNEQVRFILNHPFLAESENVLILGDFNLEPSNEVFLALEETGFSSIFSVQDLPLTFPAGASPRTTLDYIYYKLKKGIVKSPKLAYKDEVNGTYPSDHFGLAVDLIPSSL